MQFGKLSNYIGFDDTIQIEDYVKSLDRDISKLFLGFKGNIRFGDASDGEEGENIAGEFQVVSDTGNIDTEFSITHTLGATPLGYIVTKINKGGVIYDSGTAWTDTTIYLKCSAANAAVTLFLLK
jgi:hypothetical protein